MSNSQVYEPVTVESDGVTVTKRFEDDEFPVPTIVFEFVSGRDEVVRVRLSDRVPEEVAVGDLGFHPEHGSEHWEVDEERITFERELEAGAEYVTVYGVRATGTDNVEQFLAEPTLERVDPPLSGDTVAAPRARESAVDQGEVTESAESRRDGDDHAENVAELNLTDPTVTDTVNETAVGPATPDVGDTSETRVGPAIPEAGDADETSAAETDGLVAAIADEIQSGRVAAGDLELVAQALDRRENDRTGASTDVRVQQLQSEFADLRAYTIALEEFLDEEGTGEQLIEQFRAELSSFNDRLDEAESTLESSTATIEAMDETVGAVRSEVDRVDSDIEDVSAHLDEVEASVDELAEMATTVQSLEGAVDDLQSAVGDLEGELVETDVAERVGEMEAEIEDLVGWQEQIRQTFAGG